MSDAGGGVFGAGSVADNYRRHLEPVVFEPWAERLLDAVGVGPGDRVLDVAAGTGVVSRAAAARVGPGGSVVASDLSPEMLGHVLGGRGGGYGGVGLVRCSADAIPLADGSVDVALCQQGFQFFPDRPAAARELRRVLRPGGRLGMAVWRGGARLEPFSTYAEVLEAQGLPEPFPGAYDRERFWMTPDEVAALLAGAGFSAVDVTTEELEVVWPSATAAAEAIAGTPNGPALAALDARRGAALRTALVEAFGGASDRPVRQRMVAVFGRGTA